MSDELLPYRGIFHDMRRLIEEQERRTLAFNWRYVPTTPFEWPDDAALVLEVRSHPLLAVGMNDHTP